jgi:hypothetical protein
MSCLKLEQAAKGWAASSRWLKGCLSRLDNHSIACHGKALLLDKILFVCYVREKSPKETPGASE